MLRKLYGISLTQYTELFNKQDGHCAICKEISDKTLSVDHDHRTGKVRGLLCHDCNRALGQFKDSILILESATEYLYRALPA